MAYALRCIMFRKYALNCRPAPQINAVKKHVLPYTLHMSMYSIGPGLD